MLELCYQLKENEVEESLLSIGHKAEGKRKQWNLIILTVLGAYILFKYIGQPDNLMYFLLLAMIVALLFYLVYGHRMARHRKAKKIAAQKGEYRLKISKAGVYNGQSNQWMKFSDYKTKLYRSNSVYTIQMERDVFCIPRRILKKEEERQLDEIFSQSGKEIIALNIREED
jgi:predicted membrane protein